MIGLCFDIVGAFFLSVEAMGLANFRALREKILQPLHNATLSPTVKIAEPNQELRRITFGEANKLSLYITTHFLAGYLVLVAVNRIVAGFLLRLGQRGWTWMFSLRWWFIVPLAITLFFTAIFVLFSLGELVHLTITRASLSLVQFVEFIESKTATGAIGLLGFALLLLGFLLQFYGTYKGITP